MSEGFDTLPAGNGRTVESMARGELVLVEVRHGHGHVLFLAAGIGKAQVHELDLVILHHPSRLQRSSPLDLCQLWLIK
jgi:hypothetical protein